MTVEEVPASISSGFQESEISAIVKHINHQLENDMDIAEKLPLTKSNLFDNCSDGVLLWLKDINNQ